MLGGGGSFTKENEVDIIHSLLISVAGNLITRGLFAVFNTWQSRQKSAKLK